MRYYWKYLESNHHSVVTGILLHSQGKSLRKEGFHKTIWWFLVLNIDSLSLAQLSPNLAFLICGLQNWIFLPSLAFRRDGSMKSQFFRFLRQQNFRAVIGDCSSWELCCKALIGQNTLTLKTSPVLQYKWKEAGRNFSSTAVLLGQAKCVHPLEAYRA